MQYKKLIVSLLVTGLITSSLASYSQVITPTTTINTTAAADSLIDIEILPGSRKLEYLKLNDSVSLRILAGHVKLKQGNSLFFCDSCVINNYTKSFEAWGQVHINDADTIHIYSRHLLYKFENKIAFLDGNVQLKDGKGTLTTPDLEYNMANHMGIYKHGGKVVTKETILTSREGYYYADLRDVYFNGNVELKDPAYYIKTDSLLYNTESQTARFITKTIIKDSSGRTIETKDGYYNMQTGNAEFGQRPVVHEKGLFATGNQMINNDSLGIVQLKGNAVVKDSVNNTTIIAGEIFINKKNNSFLAIRKPLMIVKQEADSIYITADTLFSARLTDKYGKKDSLKKDTISGKKMVSLSNKDSSNRYFEAYRHVRIFSDSLQAIADSMFYSFKDSVFQLFQQPILWANNSQITGDTILLFTKNKKAERVKVIENSFLVNRLDPEVYNQVKSSRMDGFFKEGEIDSVRAVGFAECIYYLKDEDSAYSGINESKCDVLDIYFQQKEINKVVFRSSVTGTVWPIKHKSPEEMRLPGFQWLENKRPKTKFELFE